MAQVGSTIFLMIGGKLLVGQTSLSYAKACDMIDVSSKDSGRHREFAPGKINTTISTSGIGSDTKEASEEDWFTLNDAQDAGTPVTFVITKYTDETATTPEPGSESRTGTAYISNLTRDENDNESISYSVDLQVSGKVIVSTNA